MKYAVIIPAKNEEENISQTLDNLLSQSLKPTCILVIDNDSEDQTGKIVLKYQSNNENVKYLNYKSENSYSLGGKIVKIFHEGKSYLDNERIDYEYIAKIDADTQMESDTFEKISKHLEDKSLGIVSPLPFTLLNGRKIFVSTPDWHTSGDFKVYNKSFLESIKGIPEDLGWDCADNIIAMESGYKTIVLRDIHYKQTRPIGRYSLKKGWKRQGQGAWKLRYGYLYLFLKSLHDVFKPPFLLGSLNYLYGYFTAQINNNPRTLNKNQGKILRKLLWQSFFNRLKSGQFYIIQKISKKDQ